ncbi:MAG: ABC transporter permease [Actinobacteria bacterium]|nr:ABC transporter permease [Actinomycetota bacterium]MCA1720559.1 ABC transporter permease [Actinomycetota bacterium]
MTAVAELRQSRELFVNLTLREVRGKYKRTALGQAWSLLNPVASLAVFALVFGLLLKVQPPRGDPSGLSVFALWLAAGLLPWTFFSQAMSAGMAALSANSGLVTKVYFPREMLVASTVASFVVSFGIELSALVLALLLLGAQPLLYLPLVVVLVALLSAFALGLALALSIANTWFRDTSYLMVIVLQFWFYLTPVVYPTRLVDEAVGAGLNVFGVPIPVSHLYALNPMVRFLNAFRALLYDNRLPGWQDWVGMTVSSALALGVGLAVFNRYSPRLAEEL